MGWISLARECIAELIGTLILCAFGNASLAVFILEPKMSSSLSVHFSWGMGESMHPVTVRVRVWSNDILVHFFKALALESMFQNRYQEVISILLLR